MADKRIQYKVDGEVQGVNFRQFTAKHGEKVGVTGHVQNTPDGSVTGEAQGSHDAIDKFVQHLNKGPPAASVSNVEHSEIDAKEGESGFHVNRSS
ncbi:Acylphosphatase [Delitschia confertaspora ATCC 74209]|uniref:acylphosphatase n=1 Tax=Delitschia confertaspora ATCC 74209 TaxID=1513339 RepID=A0A9P4MVU2_9PLEO|nr:Acylphosphatase [Delitschia confertaspora ATCC 74209]